MKKSEDIPIILLLLAGNYKRLGDKRMKEKIYRKKRKKTKQS